MVYRQGRIGGQLLHGVLYEKKNDAISALICDFLIWHNVVVYILNIESIQISPKQAQNPGVHLIGEIGSSDVALLAR